MCRGEDGDCIFLSCSRWRRARRSTSGLETPKRSIAMFRKYRNICRRFMKYNDNIFIGSAIGSKVAEWLFPEEKATQHRAK